MTDPELEIHPLTIERWSDLELLFGPKGAYSGCWCMFWRMRRADFSRSNGEQRKDALQEITRRNQVPGLLAYRDGKPVGWVSLGPREDFPALTHSRILTQVDTKPVWSIVCFFVAKPLRKKGMMEELIQGAVKYAQEQGAQMVEAYPIDMQSHRLAGLHLTGYSGYMGIASAFRATGFVEVKRASETQLIMRYPIEKTQG